MKNFFYYLFYCATCALMITSVWHEEFQFVAIMCGIFVIIYKTND